MSHPGPDKKSIRPNLQSLTYPTPKAVSHHHFRTQRAAFGFVFAVCSVISSIYFYAHSTLPRPPALIFWVFLFVGCFIYVGQTKPHTTQNTPPIADSYVASTCALLATKLFAMTLGGAFIVLALLVGTTLRVFSTSTISVGAVSPTTQTLVFVGTAASFTTSLLLIKALLSHTPPFNKRQVLELIEASRAPEVVFLFALFGSPMLILFAHFIWIRPELLTLPLTLPTATILGAVSTLAVCYTAVVLRN